MTKSLEVFPAEILYCKELQEEVSRRTINSKTYIVGNNRHRLRKVIGAVHYREDNDWKEIDLTIREDDDCFIVDKTLYKLKIFKDKIGYSYKSKQGGRIDIVLNSIGDTPVNSLSLNIKPKIVSNLENRLIWKDAVAGIDFFIVVRPLGISLYKSIKNNTAPNKFSWDIYEDVVNSASFIRKTVGNDKDRDKADIKNVIDDKGILKSDETNNDYRHLVFVEEYKGRVAKIKNKRTRVKEWSNDVKYPVVIDADVTENIVADIDDGKEAQGYTTWSYTRSENPVRYGYESGYGSSASNVGVRFRSIAIPQGATITNAVLKLNVSNIINSPYAKIYGDDVDDAAQWANGNLPSGITKTTAYADWYIIATGTNSVDIKTVIQEIIDRTGWGSGNDMRFAILNAKTCGGTGTCTHEAEIDDYHKSQDVAAVLEVDYEVPPPAGKPGLNPGAMAKMMGVI